MCLCKVRETETLRRNLDVYKVFMINNLGRSYLAGPIFDLFEFIPGVNQDPEIAGVLHDDYDDAPYAAGFHCFVNKDAADGWAHKWNRPGGNYHVVMKCTIPAGTAVTFGVDRDQEAVVTPTLVLPNFNINQLEEEWQHENIPD